MIALVTGGNGFVGRYLVEQLLARGDHVRVVGRGEYPELQSARR
nr:NAD-dependent epimerase/dehydratase family protein [Chloroflexus sp.]